MVWAIECLVSVFYFVHPSLWPPVWLRATAWIMHLPSRLSLRDTPVVSPVIFVELGAVIDAFADAALQAHVSPLM